MVKQAFLVFGFLALPNALNASEFERCVSVCDPWTEQCLQLGTSKIMPPFHEQLLSVYDNAKDGILKKSDLMSIFDVDSDPCWRTSSVLQDGQILNFGKACNAVNTDFAFGFRLTIGRIVSGSTRSINEWMVAELSEMSGFVLELTSGNESIARDEWSFVASDGMRILTSIGDQCLLLE